MDFLINWNLPHCRPWALNRRRQLPGNELCPDAVQVNAVESKVQPPLGLVTQEIQYCPLAPVELFRILGSRLPYQRVKSALRPVVCLGHIVHTNPQEGNV